jgi:hypothetical protein
MDKLYITIDGDPVKLNPFDGKIAAAIKADMDAGSVLFELKSCYWSGSATNLPDNTQAVYVSGSHPNVPISGYSGVEAAGQVAVFREQNGQQKSYRYLLVESGSGNFFYGEEFKKFPDHYYTGSHPTGSIWKKQHPKWPTI